MTLSERSRFEKRFLPGRGTGEKVLVEAEFEDAESVTFGRGLSGRKDLEVTLVTCHLSFVPWLPPFRFARALPEPVAASKSGVEGVLR
jgi:hypothetical protein